MRQEDAVEWPGRPGRRLGLACWLGVGFGRISRSFIETVFLCVSFQLKLENWLVELLVVSVFGCEGCF